MKFQIKKNKIFFFIIFFCFSFPIKPVLVINPNFKIENFMNELNVDDFVEYKINAREYQQINTDGSRIGQVQVFKNNENGFFRWTVLSKNGTNVTLKIEVSINDFFSDSKEIIISNGIAYSNNLKQLGYVPFWISLNSNSKISTLNMTLDGPLNNPLIGKTNNSNDFQYFLGGERSVLKFTNPYNYIIPGIISGYTVGAYQWYFSKYNGILVKLGDYFPLLWSTLQFPYEFLGTFSLDKANIDFGSADLGLTITYYIAPLWLPILMVIIIIVFYTTNYIMKKMRKRHG